jgi:hypothetical protein
MSVPFMMLIDQSWGWSMAKLETWTSDTFQKTKGCPSQKKAY